MADYKRIATSYYEIFGIKPKRNIERMTQTEAKDLVKILKLECANRFAMSIFTNDTKTMDRCREFEKSF